MVFGDNAEERWRIPVAEGNGSRVLGGTRLIVASRTKPRLGKVLKPNHIDNPSS